MKRDDPTPTYRGYRRQALYVLSRLFEDTLNDDTVIQPEGQEDLAILGSDEQLIEVVQVKDLAANLAASSFSQFFYERTSSHCSIDSKVVVRVASFGPIGPDLLSAKSGDLSAVERIVKTITKDRETFRKKRDGTVEKIVLPGLPDAQARSFVAHVQFTSVNEAELTQSIKSALAKSVAGISQDEAFNVLMWWIITSSETRAPISRREAVQKLSTIGRFLSGRAAFHAEWNQSIIPLEDTAAEEASKEQDKLREQFFQGGRVEFRHILANVDIVRDMPIAAIHRAFDKSDVVIVHAASGQGKTTLALRYLREFAPAGFRLQLKSADDLGHARRMALAIREQTAAIGIPAIVYVDVRPGDAHWTEIVRELTSQPLIRVLVTIREEDWQRSGSSLDVLFADCPMTFDEEEARGIYESLRKEGLAKNHLDFDEAWIQFGPRKCLLEFVYFVTQAETLTNRIKSQVRTFQNEVRLGQRDETLSEERLLRLVAVASAYEGRLDLARTVRHCGVRSPQATLQRFEDEYFVRESQDGRLLDGFHAIRSEVLCECLTDPSLFPWDQVAADALPLMEEGDLESFLLCAFSRRPNSVAHLEESLGSFTPKTWRGMCGVMRALMWLGLRQYWELNREVVNEAYAENPAGWFLFCDVDVARVLNDDDWDIFAGLGESGRAASERRAELRKRQADRDVVFRPVRDWLSSASAVLPQANDPSDWRAMAEVAFWSGHLQISTKWADELDPLLISRAAESLPLFRLAEFIRGLRELRPNVVSGWWAEHKGHFVERIRREAAIANLEECDESIVAHFVIDLETQATRLPRGDESDTTTKASLHDLSIERVQMLWNLIDGKAKYGAVGYGHRLSILATPYDEAAKPGVLAENLHAVWGPTFNALSRGYSERRFRPATWQMFFEDINSRREQFLACMVDLTNAIRKSRFAGDQIEPPDVYRWDECNKAFQVPMLFPRCAVDEWGFVEDSSPASESTPGLGKRRSPNARFPGFRKALTEYQKTISNFLAQAIGALVTTPALRRAINPSQREAVLKYAQEIGTNEQSIRLSIINGFAACTAIRELHTAFDESPGLQNWRSIPLEERERDTVEAAMNEFAAFVFPPEKRFRKLAYGQHEAFAWVLRPLLGSLENRLHRLHRHDIKASILPNIIVWEGKPGLWIVADSDHPVTGAQALNLVWDAIQRAFDSDTANPVQYSVTEYVWPEIVLVQTIRGRGSDHVAFRHFRSAAFNGRSLDQAPWAVFPDQVPKEIWSQTGIQLWDRSPAQTTMDKAVASYFALMQHVQHMADLVRIPDSDELGSSIVQQYLLREEKRAEPLLQTMFDSFAAVLEIWPTLGEFHSDPNLRHSVQALIELESAVVPQPHSDDEAEQPKVHRLTLNEMVEWRDRLLEGVAVVNRASLFWTAQILCCRALQ